jgi:hypothetical protein
MSKKTLTALIIGVAILSALMTKAIDRSGGLVPYVVNVIEAVAGGIGGH